MTEPLFKSRGFYLHACWKFNYPFAVRSWSRADYQAMFKLLRCLEMDRVMLWPMIEAAPPPLSREDAAQLANFTEIIADAQELGLECWIVSAPNLSSREDIRDLPLPERHLYPHMVAYRFDQADQYRAYTAHLEQLLAVVNNADGYVFIDGDPGGYPGAKPGDYLRLLQDARQIVNRVGKDPSRQKVIPWIWCGWGTDWVSQGPWKPELRPLVEPVLHLLKEHPLEEPWELLPGRSIREGWANGRLNFEMTEEAGLIGRSTLMTYEIIEFEPTPPAVVLQFEDIRRVIRQEQRYAGQARGIFGNTQQPVMSLPNLFYFSRCTRDPACLDWSDQQVLKALADFLGGAVEPLSSAWRCLQAGLDDLSPDLPDRIRSVQLKSEAAQYLPGGQARYLEILAALVEVRLAVLKAVSSAPVSDADAVNRLTRAINALNQWWQRHGYVFSGEGRTGFSWEYTHPLLFHPLKVWIERYFKSPQALVEACADPLISQWLKELCDYPANTIDQLAED